MVGKDTRNFLDAFFFGSKNTSMSGDYIEIPVNDNGVDKAELPEGGAELRNLLRGVGAGVVHIGHQFADWHQLHFRCRFHRTSPHSANFSKPPRDWMYLRAVSTISA